MATYSAFAPWDNGLFSNFKTWAQLPGTALSNFGWTLASGVSGMVNWGTIAYGPGRSAPSGFGILAYATWNFRGAWSNASVTYSANDTVTSAGTTWICRSGYTTSASSPSPENELINGSEHWLVNAFEIWQSATTPTLYIRLEYNAVNPNSPYYPYQPAIRIGVTQSVDSNGNMGTTAGTTVTGPVSLPFGYVSPTGGGNFGQAQYPCYFSGDNGNRFGMVMWSNLSNLLATAGGGGGLFFGFERSLDNTGAYYTANAGPTFVRQYTMVNSQTLTGITMNAGDLAIINIRWNDVTNTISGVTDTLGNTWLHAPNTHQTQTTNNYSQDVWYSFLTNSGTGNIVVASTPGSLNTPRTTGAEFSGLTAIDQSAGTFSNSSVQAVTPSVTTTSTDELAWAAFFLGSGGGGGTSVSGWVQLTNSIAPGFFQDAYVFPYYTGNYQAVNSATNEPYTASLTTFSASQAPVIPYYTCIWAGTNAGTAFCNWQATLQIGTGGANGTWLNTTLDSGLPTMLANYQNSNPPDDETNDSRYWSAATTASIPVFPIFPLVGWVGNPLTVALSGKYTDMPYEATQFTIPMYGTTRTFLGFREYYAFGAAGSTANSVYTNALAMRYD